MSGLTIDGIEIPRDIEATKGGKVIADYIAAAKDGKGEAFLDKHRADIEKAEKAAAKKAEKAAAVEGTPPQGEKEE